MKNKFWKNKNIFITGYEGFLGSNLTKRLISCGANIVGLDIKVRRKNTILTENDYEKIVVVQGNVANYKLLNEIISGYNIEIIFHLAAEAIVGKCLKNPLRTFTSNIRGSWNILDVCRRLPIVKAIIIASSDKAYGSHSQLPYKENTPLSGGHPYDVSKSCADLIAYTYYHTYDLPVVVTRCGNIYGPGDFNFSRIVPDAIWSILKNKPLIIRSDGNFTRDYIYVDDVVDAYLLSVEKMEELKLFGEAFNFSNESPISVLKLVKKIYQGTNKKPDYKILEKAKYEIKHQYLSSKKARRVLGWQPKITLDEGLKKTIQWYRDY
ncbi:MAG TPA: NAD-dependent epimerase/dehydratase family protein [Candidatus Scalindua sp.]|nr:NAD-dependent epimerase/dehydratase family protein [Candidatus Scalindua sp.]